MEQVGGPSKGNKERVMKHQWLGVVTMDQESGEIKQSWKGIGIPLGRDLKGRVKEESGWARWGTPRFLRGTDELVVQVFAARKETSLNNNTKNEASGLLFSCGKNGSQGRKAGEQKEINTSQKQRFGEKS